MVEHPTPDRKVARSIRVQVIFLFCLFGGGKCFCLSPGMTFLLGLGDLWVCMIMRA